MGRGLLIVRKGVGMELLIMTIWIGLKLQIWMGLGLLIVGVKILEENLDSSV